MWCSGLQSTVRGVIYAELLAVTDAQFSKFGDARDFGHLVA
jgi:hypothetical protein